MRQIICFLISFMSLGLYAQTSEKYNSSYFDFYAAEDLYLKSQYSAARETFRAFINQKNDPTDPRVIEARYYEGLSALELYQNDAVDLLLKFNQDYPESIYKNNIYWKLATYFYQKKDYSTVLEWTDRLAITDIDPDDIDEFNFKIGYSYFSTEQMKKARNAFFEVKDGDSQYATPSLYYYSHIEYTFGSFQNALEGFEKLLNDERFGRVAPYYVAQIYFLQNRYEDVLTLGPGILDSVPKAYKNDLTLIIGDSYYKTGKYKESIPYLSSYNLKNRTTLEMDYQLGYAYLKAQQYDKAIPYLDRATKGNEELSQIAFYQIGECYLQSNNLPTARAAFEQATKIEFDPKVSEDALYQYAILSYKLVLNPYNEAVIALEKYLTTYPDSPRNDDVYQYLVNVYATTNQYEKALASLDRLPKKDYKLKSIYQVVAFNAGVEQYQKAEFEEAIRYFDLVSKYPVEIEVTSKALFWKGDSEYRRQQYIRAIKFYREYISSGGAKGELKADAYYNVGYAYLELKDTLTAIESLELYTRQNTKNGHKLADAWMRIGDGYYSMKENAQALTAYNMVLSIRQGYEDQALYYKGKTLGYMSNRLSEKIAAHEEILKAHPSSKYVQQSILEIAVSYKILGQFKTSMDYYKRFKTEYPSSLEVKEVELEIAGLYFKMDDYKKAELAYKAVLEKYPDDRAICFAGGEGLVGIYKAQRTPEKISEINSKYPCAQVDANEEEDVFYTTAYEDYENKKYDAAIASISKYLNRFPTGKYSTELTFFLGDSYWESGDTLSAMDQYEIFLQKPDNGYTEIAAVRLSKFMYENEEYNDALFYYKKLEKVSSTPEVIFNAQIGIMRTSFYVENWQEASGYASLLINSNQLKEDKKLEAHYAKGISNYKLNNIADATASLEWIVKNTTTAMAAEAKFTLADMQYMAGDYESSENTIRELMKMKPSYNYWIARGLILQSRTAIAKDELFQAEQTLKSVLDHYPKKDDGILLEAQQLWDELMQLKNKPKENVDESAPVIEIDGEE